MFATTAGNISRVSFADSTLTATALEFDHLERRAVEPVKLVISGVPCCGKTKFGDWLRDHEQFAHANLEPRHNMPEIVMHPEINQDLVRWLGTLSRRLVITWGFAPSADAFEVLRVFRAAGFTLWWFEGDYELSREHYVKRDGDSAARLFFDRQKQRLVEFSSRIRGFYGAHRLTTLSSDGLMSFSEMYERICGSTAISSTGRSSGGVRPLNSSAIAAE